MPPENSMNHTSANQHPGQQAPGLQELAPAPPAGRAAPTSTAGTHPAQEITSAVTAATAAQAAAVAAAAGRDMKNFSDIEINELLGLIPDEYTAEQEAEEAAATAAANAAMALGKGVHHNVTATTLSVPSNILRASSTNATDLKQSRGTKNGNTSIQGKSQDDHIAAQEAQLRSERKRSREKQRRNDVNRQFAELTEVLKNIEREAQEMGRNDDAYGSVSTMMAIAASTGPTNRVDLIARTIVHLERLNRTAKKQRLEISSLQEQLERTKKSGEDMAEKLKDVMFNQQRQFTTSTFPPYPNMTRQPVTAVEGTQAAPAPGVNSVPTTNGLSSLPTSHQQQMPVMMMMMPPPTTQSPNTSSVSTGAPGPATMQHQPQQQFMMVMPHPGSQVSMPMQPVQHMMQTMPTTHQHQHQQQQQQQPQPVVQRQQQVQAPIAQQQIYVQQQQQQQPVGPTTQRCRGKGSSGAGENLAHAA
ncbi:unnamed protein product [Pseudo-nitzschia multistriata]|uniref:BHLH domain-containing protein n=1 Tax=Pseudo-nitzschia multistriata TaxID=183589 RepID=A0A448ZHY7_9STRA|nr:unnamed protein product [Pseudo-nitzschia multistriata]